LIISKAQYLDIFCAKKIITLRIIVLLFAVVTAIKFYRQLKLCAVKSNNEPAYDMLTTEFCVCYPSVA